MKNFEDALIYVKRLKQRLPARSQKYEEFRSIMKEFDNRKIDSAAVAARMNSLFEGHKDLIDEFNTFLPENNNDAENCIITSSEPPLLMPSSSNTKAPLPMLPSSSHPRARSILSKQRDCIKFLNELRNDSTKDEYRQFLEALNEYDSHKDIKSLDQQVSDIFAKNPMLYINFTRQTVDIFEALYENQEESKAIKRLNCEEQQQQQEDIMERPEKKSRIFEF